MVVFSYMLISVPLVAKLSLYKLYIVPYGTTAYILLVIWIILVIIYLYKIVINIKRLHKGI